MVSVISLVCNLIIMGKIKVLTKSVKTRAIDRNEKMADVHFRKCIVSEKLCLLKDKHKREYIFKRV